MATWTTSGKVDSKNYDGMVTYDYVNNVVASFQTNLANLKAGNYYYSDIVDTMEYYLSAIKLDLSSFGLPSSTITSATVNISNGGYAKFLKINNYWDLNTTADNMWTYLKTNATAINTTGVSGTPVSYDITATVKAWIDNPASNFGFAVDDSQGQKTSTPSNSYNFTFSGITISDTQILSSPSIIITYDNGVANFKATPNSQSITWTWDALPTADYYEIYDGSGTKLAEIPAGTTTWTDTGLTPNTSYTRKITYKKTGVEGSTFNTQTVTTLLSLVPVTTFASSSTSSTMITWSWTDSSNQNVTSYDLLDKYGSVIQSFSPSTTQWKERRLRYGTTYIRQIRANRGNEASGLKSTSATTNGRGLTSNLTNQTASIYGTSVGIRSDKPTTINDPAYNPSVGFTWNSTYISRALLNLDFSPLAYDGVVLNSITFKPYFTLTPSTQTLFVLRKITSPWNLYNSTWSNQPSFDSTDVGSTSSITANTTGSIALTASVLQTFIDNPNTNYGLIMKANDETIASTYTTFTTSLDPTHKTYYAINYDVIASPTPPTGLTGSSGTNSITWSWSGSDSTATEFRIYNSDTDVLVGTVSYPTMNYTETGTTNGQTYNRYVVAYNKGGETSAASTSYTMGASNIVLMEAVKMASTSSVYAKPEVVDVSVVTAESVALHSTSTISITFDDLGTLLSFSAQFNSTSLVSVSAYIITGSVFAITGNAKLADNTPISGAAIYIVKDDGSTAFKTLTDSSGHYSINVSESGIYHAMCLYKDGYGNKYSSLTLPFITVAIG